MKQTKTIFRGIRRILLSALCMCLIASSVMPLSASTTMLEPALYELSLPQIFGSTTFEVNGKTFYRLTLPQDVIDRYAESSYAVAVGTRDARVQELKEKLYRSGFRSNSNRVENFEYVTDTQIRPEVIDYFDDHLATLFETVYLFCGIEDKTPCLDELTAYLIDEVLACDYKMRTDVETVYKYKLIEKDSQGTIGRSGAADGMYYYAQTDPDWAAEPFEYEGNGATIKDRGCGTACGAMVFSTYHKVEITPRTMASYVGPGGVAQQVSYGLPNEYFIGLARTYARFEEHRYGTVVAEPKILLKSQVDFTDLADRIGNQGQLAIIHVLAGAFTSHEHYMVLQDYVELDGVGYFLVADPYIQQSRYRDWDQLRKVEGDNEGLIYATPYVLQRDCKSIILFEQDKNAFPMPTRSVSSTRIGRAR